MGCGCAPSGCCAGEAHSPADATSSRLGYSDEELASVPEGANMGLGCGNPQAIAALKPGSRPWAAHQGRDRLLRAPLP